MHYSMVIMKLRKRKVSQKTLIKNQHISLVQVWPHLLVLYF